MGMLVAVAGGGGSSGAVPQERGRGRTEVGTQTLCLCHPPAFPALSSNSHVQQHGQDRRGPEDRRAAEAGGVAGSGRAPGLLRDSRQR
ncbi:guanine nucleotide-binding protein G(I)/G(S)/G(O) subunit gamma-8 isoform X1 [Bubalus kerabau]|uniref:guanine nucleotide-binding protein G(I)/G(S)/G(O) subunit gamma-8 isoform X1 n=1 Tax=Bubalus carabanensis TaxID=3119969 RepID=UPI000DBCA81B|nr:guanine nucleotide-binding protein G(I)/G(S)/G(O) subunit gamma-8 isoform X1 [Bubalus carabanensis]